MDICNELITDSRFQFDRKSCMVVESTGVTTKSAEFLIRKRKCNKVVADIKSKFDCKLKVLLCIMLKISKKVEVWAKQQNKKLSIIYGCGTHWLNFLSRDIKFSAVIHSWSSQIFSANS